nr:DUF4158 domain-containing protein [Streptomyces sp. NBC_00830]
MPTYFLSEDQRRRFGRFAEDPDEGQLAGSFLLDQTARRRAMAAKARNRIGWAVQLGTVRYLGTFLDNSEQVPGVVVDFVAEQLGLKAAEFAGYGTKEHRWDHQEQIREGYGYTKFEFDHWFALARWMYRRAWIGSERPTLLFDLATKRLVDKKVVLPGVTVLERLVSGSRERAEKRLWAPPARRQRCTSRPRRTPCAACSPTGSRTSASWRSYDSAPRPTSISSERALPATRDPRPAVLLYVGDFDCSGDDIQRDWVARTDCWSTVERVLLTREQVLTYEVPAAEGKRVVTAPAHDSRGRS